jgi:hypothetical protein
MGTSATPVLPLRLDVPAPARVMLLAEPVETPGVTVTVEVNGTAAKADVAATSAIADTRTETARIAEPY